MTKALEESFLEGIGLNKDKLYRICLAYAEDSEDARDLFQDVIVNIWRAMPNFSRKSSLATWMFRITLNVCLRLRSSQMKRKELIINIDSPYLENIGSVEGTDEQKDQLLSLRNCIRKLHDADKSIITLYLEELPYKEISAITGLAENTIAVKVKRVKEKLLNCMNKER